MDIDSEVERLGCKIQYEALQLCLAENDRNWVKCQNLVKEWQDCFKKTNKN